MKLYFLISREENSILLENEVVDEDYLKWKSDEEENFMQITSEKPSIAQSKKEIIERLKIPSCFLCTNTHFTDMSSLRRHFTMLHLRNVLHIGIYIILPCKLDCSGSGYYHYHCPNPSCNYLSHEKQELFIHFSLHVNSESKISVWKEHVNSKDCITNQMKMLGLPSPKNTLISLMVTTYLTIPFYPMVFCYMRNFAFRFVIYVMMAGLTSSCPNWKSILSLLI